MFKDLRKNRKNPSDVKHFEELVSPIYEGLYKYIYCIVSNKVLAEDALQNTLLNGYTHISELKDTNKFKYWIYTIGKRESINILRKYKREIPVDSEGFEVIENEQSILPDDYVLNSELQDTVVKIINELDSRDREIVLLHYYGDLKLQEISEILNINNNTIRTRHRCIKRKIYELLIAAGMFEEERAE